MNIRSRVFTHRADSGLHSLEAHARCQTLLKINLNGEYNGLASDELVGAANQILRELYHTKNVLTAISPGSLR
jgi:hypothetical protein